MKFLGINFDLLDTPLEKRLGILVNAVAYFAIVFAGPISTLFCLYLLFTPLNWLVLLYFCWIYLDRNASESGGRPIEWYQNLKIWKYGYDYYQRTFKLAPGFTLKPNKNYLFAYCPHGVVPLGSISSFIYKKSEFRKLYPTFRIKSATLRIVFILPFVREFFLGGEFISCSYNSLNYALNYPKGGNIVLLCPGGSVECAYSQYEPEVYRCAIKNRKGFVKIALETGASLVPVITFGENNLLAVQKSVCRKFRWVTEKLPFLAGVCFNGRGLFQRNFGFVPRDTPIMTVVGNPIEVPKIENPNKQQIDELHEKFIQELIQLFEKYKPKYFENPHEKFLEII